MASRFPISPITLLLSVLIVISVSVRPSNAATEQIDKVCKKTSNYSFCVGVLSSNGWALMPNADLVTIAYAAFNPAYDSAIKTKDYIGSLLEDTNDPALQESLKRCQADYEHVAEKMTQAVSNLDSRSYGSIDDLAEEAAAKVDDCQSGLSGGAARSQLADKNRVQKAHCEIGAVVGRMINSPGAVF